MRSLFSPRTARTRVSQCSQLGTSALLLVTTWLFAPERTLAQDGLADAPTLGQGEGQLGTLLSNLVDLINDVLVPLLLAIGFLVFIWGMFRYFVAGSGNDELRASGRNLAVYAITGFMIVVIFWGIVNLLALSTGLVMDDADRTDMRDSMLPKVNKF